jgi:hypothetical protein
LDTAPEGAAEVACGIALGVGPVVTAGAAPRVELGAKITVGAVVMLGRTAIVTRSVLTGAHARESSR